MGDVKEDITHQWLDGGRGHAAGQELAAWSIQTLKIMQAKKR